MQSQRYKSTTKKRNVNFSHISSDDDSSVSLSKKKHHKYKRKSTADKGKLNLNYGQPTSPTHSSHSRHSHLSKASKHSKHSKHSRHDSKHDSRHDSRHQKHSSQQQQGGNQLMDQLAYNGGSLTNLRFMIEKIKHLQQKRKEKQMLLPGYQVPVEETLPSYEHVKSKYMHYLQNPNTDLSGVSPSLHAKHQRDNSRSSSKNSRSPPFNPKFGKAFTQHRQSTKSNKRVRLVEEESESTLRMQKQGSSPNTTKWSKPAPFPSAILSNEDLNLNSRPTEKQMSTARSPNDSLKNGNSLEVAHCHGTTDIPAPKRLVAASQMAKQAARNSSTNPLTPENLLRGSGVNIYKDKYVESSQMNQTDQASRLDPNGSSPQGEQVSSQLPSQSALNNLTMFGTSQLQNNISTMSTKNMANLFREIGTSSIIKRAKILKEHTQGLVFNMNQWASKNLNPAASSHSRSRRNMTSQVLSPNNRSPVGRRPLTGVASQSRMKSKYSQKILLPKSTGPTNLQVGPNQSQKPHSKSNAQLASQYEPDSSEGLFSAPGSRLMKRRIATANPSRIVKRNNKVMTLPTAIPGSIKDKNRIWVFSHKSRSGNPSHLQIGGTKESIQQMATDDGTFNQLTGADSVEAPLNQRGVGQHPNPFSQLTGVSKSSIRFGGESTSKDKSRNSQGDYFSGVGPGAGVGKSNPTATNPNSTLYNELEASGVYQMGVDGSNNNNKDSSTASYLQQRKPSDMKSSPQVPVFDFSSANPMINKVNTEIIDDSTSPKPILSDQLQKNLEGAIGRSEEEPTASEITGIQEQVEPKTAAAAVSGQGANLIIIQDESQEPSGPKSSGGIARNSQSKKLTMQAAQTQVLNNQKPLNPHLFSQPPQQSSVAYSNRNLTGRKSSNDGGSKFSRTRGSQGSLHRNYHPSASNQQSCFNVVLRNAQQFERTSHLSRRRGGSRKPNQTASGATFKTFLSPKSKLLQNEIQAREAQRRLKNNELETGINLLRAYGNFSEFKKESKRMIRSKCGKDQHQNAPRQIDLTKKFQNPPTHNILETAQCRQHENSVLQKNRIQLELIKNYFDKKKSTHNTSMENCTPTMQGSLPSTYLPSQAPTRLGHQKSGKASPFLIELQKKNVNSSMSSTVSEFVSASDIRSDNQFKRLFSKILEDKSIQKRFEKFISSEVEIAQKQMDDQGVTDYSQLPDHSKDHSNEQNSVEASVEPMGSTQSQVLVNIKEDDPIALYQNMFQHESSRNTHKERVSNSQGIKGSRYSHKRKMGHLRRASDIVDDYSSNSKPKGRGNRKVGARKGRRIQTANRQSIPNQLAVPHDRIFVNHPAFNQADDSAGFQNSEGFNPLSGDNTVERSDNTKGRSIAGEEVAGPDVGLNYLANEALTGVPAEKQKVNSAMVSCSPK